MRLLRLFPLCCVRAAVLVAVLVAFHQFAAAQRPAVRAKAAAEPYVLQTYEVGDLVFDVPDYHYPAQTESARPARGGMGGMGVGGGMGGVQMTGAVPMSRANSSNIAMADLYRVLAALVTPTGPQANVGGAHPGMGPGMMGPMGMAESGYGGGSMGPVGPAGPMLGPAGPGGAGPGQAASQPKSQAEIQILGNTLIIRQTPSVHRQIEQLLAALRGGSAARKTVSIDARWLVLDSNDLDRLVTTDDNGDRQIDRKVLAECTRRPTSIRGLMKCFSGQLVYLVGGTRRNVVSGYIPVVGAIDSTPQADGQFVTLTSGARITYTQMGMTPAGPSSSSSVGYQPIVEKPNFGALLEIRPSLAYRSGRAMVDVRSTVTTPGRPIPSLRQGAAGPRVPDVDRVAVETQELATTLEVPLGQPVLVGGLTYVSNTPPSQDPAGLAGARMPEPSETPQLYLVLELR